MILVIDTSGSSLGIGLADDTGHLIQEFRAEARADERGIHDARLAAETADILLSNHVPPSEIRRIGLVIGPGSFTGLRIGLSFAKGFAYACGAALVPMTQHEVIASEGVRGRIITPGYREDLFYVAESNSPGAIRLLSRDELGATPTTQSPSVSALAKLTAESHSTALADQIDALEPLYLTEFKPSEH